MTEVAKRLEQGFSIERDRGKLEEAYKAVIDIYAKVVDLKNDASEQVPGSPSIKVDLLHQVAHSSLRIQALADGGFTSYKYEEVNPDAYEAIKNLSAKELLEAYRGNAQKLLALFSEPGLGQKIFKLPFGKTDFGPNLLSDIARHEEYHLGKLSVVEAYLGLGRSKSLDDHWGPPLK